MADDLMAYVDNQPVTRFRPQPYYGAHEDSLTFYFREDESYAQRVDDLLTVYLSLATNELVGCQIKGVRRILETLGDFGVMVEKEKSKLSVLFLPGAFSRDPERRKRYEEIGRAARDVPLNEEILMTA